MWWSLLSLVCEDGADPWLRLVIFRSVVKLYDKKSQSAFGRFLISSCFKDLGSCCEKISLCWWFLEEMLVERWMMWFFGRGIVCERTGKS